MITAKHANVLAGSMLGIMFVLMFASAWHDSGIMDELAHIPAGYSYLTQKDMRLNPEHPPLIKNLAALPLLLLDINFPTDVKAWAQDLNGQWDMGRIMLYEAGNDPDQILHWSRFPMMLLAILFGWLLFAWTKKRFGPGVALMTLAFFAFSPTFIAHSRYVTTDLAAAFGFFIGIAAFIDFIENPTRKHLVIAGIALGVALLLKFSLFLLLVVYGVITLLWVASTFTHPSEHLSRSQRLGHALRHGAMLVGKLALVGIVALALVWIVYIWHVWNYPQDKQLADATELLSSFGKRYLVNFDLWLIANPFTRPIGQYVLGLLMVVQRAAGGNTTYFLGEVNNSGWWYYFPVVYALKEPLALHIATLIALALGMRSWFAQRSFKLLTWVRTHIAEATMLTFIAIYWAYSIDSPLNIGVRHVLPTFPFIYLLVSKRLLDWARHVPIPNPRTTAEALSDLYHRYVLGLPKHLLIGALLFWTMFHTLIAFPAYLSYFNEVVGGSREGYRYAVDSNYDWGQDLKRLAYYVQAHKIDRIAIDYFGAGSPEYYLGSAAEPWSSARGPVRGYFAVSASFRQGAYGETPPWFTRAPQDSYEWLRPHEPVARAGESIFIYNLP